MSTSPTYNPHGANRFDGVDKTGEGGEFVAYLRQYGTTPFVTDYVRRSIEQLGLCEGMSHLEVGCGTAHDVDLLVTAVGPSGRVVLIDKSQEMALATQDTIESLELPGNRLHFLIADAAKLPIEKAFHSTRIIRVLQHLDVPSTALAEMGQALYPMGRLCAIEPNWSATTIVSDDQKTTGAFLHDVHHNIVKHPSIGEQLPNLCLAAGLKVVRHDELIHRFDTLEALAQVINVNDRLSTLVGRGKIEQSAAERWLCELSDRSRKGTFDAALPVGFVIAEKG
jgi:SAM-dependent methyltransferase